MLKTFEELGAGVNNNTPLDAVGGTIPTKLSSTSTTYAVSAVFVMMPNCNTMITAAPFTLTGNEATTITGNAVTASGATDSDSTATLTVSVVTPPANAQTFSVAPGGAVTYVSKTNFHGNDPATLAFGDDKGTTPVNVIMTMVVTQDQAPICPVDAVTLEQGQPSTFSTDSLCTSPLGYALQVTSVGAASHGTATQNGSSITYTPDANYVGTDSITYVTSDGHGGTTTGEIDITVTPGPVAGNYTFTIHINTSLTKNVLTDTTGSPSTSGSAPATAVGTLPSGVTLAADGTLTVTPPASSVTTITVNYTVTDGLGTTSAPGTVTVKIIDDAPVAVDDFFTMTENTTLSASNSILGNDTDDDGPLPLSTGAVVQSLTTANGGAVVVDPDGTFTYTPNHNFVGVDSFPYFSCDAIAVCSALAGTVHIHVVAALTATPAIMVTYSGGGWLCYLLAHVLPPGMFHAFDTTTGLVPGTANVTIPNIDAGIKTCLTTADGNFCYVGAGALVPYQITTGPLLTENTPNTLIPNIVGVERAMASVHTATGDFVYALARIMQASGPDVFYIFQFAVVGGSLVPLSPASLAVLPAGGSLAIDPSGKFLYTDGYATATGASGQALTVSGPLIQQFAINSDGTLAALSPATLASTRPNALTSHLAISPDGASLYQPGSDGAGNFIAQYTRQADGTLVAQAPGIVMTTVNPFEMALTGAFAYAVDISGSILELSVNATGGLASVATFPLATCTHASNLTLDPVDQLLLVPCPQPGNIQALDINAADGSLTPTSWSPQVISGQIPANTYYFAPLL